MLMQHESGFVVQGHICGHKQENTSSVYIYRRCIKTNVYFFFIHYRACKVESTVCLIACPATHVLEKLMQGTHFLLTHCLDWVKQWPSSVLTPCGQTK